MPAGRWTILRTGHTITGRRVATALPESDGLEVDQLSRAGVEKQFRSLGEILLADASPLAGKTVPRQNRIARVFKRLGVSSQHCQAPKLNVAKDL